MQQCVTTLFQENLNQAKANKKYLRIKLRKGFSPSKITMKKKIIIIGPAYPYRGGNSLFVSHLYDLLNESFEVKIYNYKLLYPSFLFPGSTQYDKSDSLIKKAPNERLINSINPLNWFSVAQKLKKENADLIIFDWWHPFFALCHFTISQLIQKVYRGKIIFLTENFISHEGSIFDRVLTRIGLSNADKFVVLSEKVHKEISIFAPEKLVYISELPIYDCYDFKQTPPSKKEFGFEEDDIVLLFFGYIRKYKGLDILIDAMPSLRKLNSKLKLLIVGESYDDITKYTSKISALGLENSVKLINNFVPNEEVGKYYSVADLVVLPYRSATQSGILNVAYGFGKPVLVTNVGGLAESVDEGLTGFVIEPEDASQITSGVQKYIEAKNKVDFYTNIMTKNKSNLFYTLPGIFKEIINGLSNRTQKT